MVANHCLLLSLFVIFINMCSGSTSPNFQTKRSVKLSNGSTITVSYINMKRVENHALEVAPIRQVSVTNESNCAKECIAAGGGSNCTSINVENVDDGIFTCEILNTDMYRSSQKFTQRNSTNHYYIMNKCIKHPCTLPSKCIPDYENNTYSCMLPPTLPPPPPPQSCTDITHLNLTSGYYNLTKPNGDLLLVYCDTVTDKGGWMLIANVSTINRPSFDFDNSVHPTSNFQNLQTGLFVMDGKELLPFHKEIAPIKEFRFYCYKPSLESVESKRRTVNLVVSKGKKCGRRLVENLIGITNEIKYEDCLDAFRALPKDNSRLINPNIMVWTSNITKRYSTTPFANQNVKSFYNLEKGKCDDGATSPGVWKIFVRSKL